MTSRLKHKLELDNVNLKSAYLNESFVIVRYSSFQFFLFAPTSHSSVLAPPSCDPSNSFTDLLQIGTPLPALAETRKDQLEYVPEWKQEVRPFIL